MAFRPLALAWLLVCGAACAQVPQRNINFDLLAAARSGNVAVVASLLDQGANPNPRNRLGDTPLNTAARNGQLELARLLLAHGADVDLPNLASVTPLMSAAFGGHEPVVRELLAHRAEGRRG